MTKITVSNTIHAPLALVWDCWTKPEHITNWNFASDDWETKQAKNDLRVGGKFSSIMAAKDGTVEFDFTGTYSAVSPQKEIAYIMEDGRTVHITFRESAGVTVTETFDPESENSEELQRAGWQAILDNFKAYVERLAQ